MQAIRKQLRSKQEKEIFPVRLPRHGTLAITGVTSLRPIALPRNWTKKNAEVDMFWVCIAIPEDLHLRRDHPNNPWSDRPRQRNERNRQHQRECLPPRMSSREPGLTQYGPGCPQSFDQQCELGIGARKPFRPRSSRNGECLRHFSKIAWLACEAARR